ncbi:MAG TPA: hypothetical protein VEJ23_01065 [Solirubrobacteraceae bacterium]|nr:hypothetical protein [Solirubrobacteraceae bacterium]
MPTRLLASLINCLVVLTALALAIGAGAVAVRFVGRKRPKVLERAGGVLEEVRRRRMSGGPERRAVGTRSRLSSPKVRLGLRLLGVASRVRRDGRQSVGARVVGIRLVSARTGAAPSLRQRLIRVVTHTAWRVLIERLIPPPKTVVAHDDHELRSAIAAARREHAEDQEALQEAMLTIYRERKIDPSRPLLLFLVRTAIMAAIQIPFPGSTLKQTLPDRLAGTIVVVDRPRGVSCAWPRGGVIRRR